MEVSPHLIKVTVSSSSVRKRRGEEIEADVRRAIAERKRACMTWKRSLLGKQYIQSDVLAPPPLPSSPVKYQKAASPLNSLPFFRGKGYHGNVKLLNSEREPPV